MAKTHNDSGQGGSGQGGSGQAGRHSTQADVAKLAGVSVATVSYVANGRRPGRKIAATPEITDRVRKAMRELDYTPRRAGRVLARNRTDLVAVAAYAPFNPWMLNLITEVEEVAAERGLGVVILRYGHTVQATDRVEQQLLDGLADAAFVFGSAEFSAARLHRIGGRMPVLVTGDRYRPRQFDVLAQQHAAAVREAAELFVRHKVRRPAYFGGTEGDNKDRVDVFVSTFRDHGYPEESIIVAEGHPSESGFFEFRDQAMGLVDRPRNKRPDAILASADRGAIAVIWAAMQLGISVPGELKVIGSGNITEGTEINPALTTIGADTMAYRPVLERLLDRIEAPDTATRTLAVPWRLILRDTA